MKTYTDEEKIATLRELGDETAATVEKGVFSKQELRLVKKLLTMLLGRKPTAEEMLKYQN